MRNVNVVNEVAVETTTTKDVTVPKAPTEELWTKLKLIKPAL